MPCNAANQALEMSVGSEANAVSGDTPHDEFLELMTAFQIRLFGYVFSLVADEEAAADIVQETNIVLLKRRNDFRPGTDFKAWSFRIAHFQVMAHRRRAGRERLQFNGDLLSLIAVEAPQRDEVWVGRADRLKECIRRLSPLYQEVVRLRYVEGLSGHKLAAVLGRSASATSQLLSRVRERLIECARRSDVGERGKS